MIVSDEIIGPCEIMCELYQKYQSRWRFVQDTKDFN
jgi:hypothetical protein